MKTYSHVYFIGIGGIGMSALARWFNANNYHVAGYDRTTTTLTQQLEQEGMSIHYHDGVEFIPSDYTGVDVLVVFTPAIPQDSIELNYFKNQGNEVLKRSEVLGWITQNIFTIAVAGTHGKTTTSSMVAHVMKHCGKNTFAFLGGITQNYNTNLLLGDSDAGEPLMVVEADEYDRSFLRLQPNITVVTSMDPDHLDIYKDESDFVNTFQEFVDKLKPGGILIHKQGLGLHTNDGISKADFGEDNAYYAAKNIRIEDAQFVFDIDVNGQQDTAQPVRMITPGLHNVMNALAAYAVGKSLAIPSKKLVEALSTFRGVKRRFEYIVKHEKVVYIDDYAHHPTEIHAFASAVKTLYPSKLLTLVFQPHLFSRTRDFMDAFAESLSIADSVVLLDIYPARELPIEGITSAVLLSKITTTKKVLLAKENVLEYLSNEGTEIIATVGAGDVDKFVPMVEKMLKEKYEI